ncbi:hypothetical protein FBQ83_02405 [Chloroflexi bacterium CFX5]|nr:hypothetical protein [Chloroflexota bacterium]MDL1918158.1 hypothetical protein [Chloroflexi bacterium CFX5]NUQ60382.1 hypothetical protein [Anaerolineales bacterium]
MNPQPYIPGFKPADAGPLSRFLPALEDGVVSGWLSHLAPPFDAARPSGALQGKSGSWLLDPFGFSPKLALEAARSGFRVLVTANNPITRFLLEIFADPPPESEFTAALADLGAVKKGDERLELHLQSLYLTQCEKCESQTHARAFLWRRGEDAPYAKIYDCKHCGDAGERVATDADRENAKRIAATDALHRTRLFERVAPLKDEDRIYAEEAIEHYLPRPLYAIGTILNRLDGMTLPTLRKRALTALLLLAFDAGNTLWAHPAGRPRPKQLSTPNQFREENLWTMLERGVGLFAGSGSPVPFEAWPRKIPETGGIVIYEGRLKDLAHEVKREIPITAVVSSIPRPNQAFWTLSALWAGWLWGREAVEPYKIALRRRRYDWAWNATALYAMFSHLNELLADGVPVFGIMPEPEAPFMTSALTAAQAAGFVLESVALRTEHDPAQVLWKSGSKPTPAPLEIETIRKGAREFLSARGEPAGYLHVHTAGLIALAQSNALKQDGDEWDVAMRKTQNAMEEALKGGKEFAHYSSGEAVDTGMWGPATARRLQRRSAQDESLSDKVEAAVVTYLQKNPEAIYLEVEGELNKQFPGLMTPSKGLIYAVLNSYADKDGGIWTLRREDYAAARRDEMQKVFDLIEEIGKRLDYKSKQEGRILTWFEQGGSARKFYVLASALIHRALERADEQTVIVIPGGRAALAAYKQERDPSLKESLKKHRLVKYRALRGLLELPILTRETFEEQIVSDPVEKAVGQMMMF